MRDRGAFLARAGQLLAPTIRTLRSVPFVFGESPTLADAALYGNLAMLMEADASLPGELGSELLGYMARLEAFVRSSIRNGLRA